MPLTHNNNNKDTTNMKETLYITLQKKSAVLNVRQIVKIILW